MLIVLAPSILAADITTDTVYKWLDDKGEIHYSSTPPPTNTKYTQSILDAGNLVIYESKVADPSITQQLTGNNHSQDSIYCHKLRNNLTTLHKNKRVRVRHSNGQFIELDESAKKGRITEISTLLKKHCHNIATK